MPKRDIRNWSPFPLPKRAYPAAGGPSRGGLAPVRGPSAPMHLFRQVSEQISITNAQATGTFGASGTLTLSVGPAGAGTVWYPASAVISTSVGILDSAQCNIYIGPLNTPVSLQGPVFTGGGAVVSLAIPAMTPGLFIIAVWTGGTNGATASLNVTGTQTVLLRVS